MEVPEFLNSDWGKMDRPAHLHLGFQALSHFYQKHKQFPGPHSDHHAEELIAIAKEFNAKLSQKLVEEVDQKLLKLLAYGAQGELGPIVCF